MKNFVFFSIFNLSFLAMKAQVSFDSISISRFLINENLYEANWEDSLKTGVFSKYIAGEKPVWIRPLKSAKVLPSIFSLANRIKGNGTADVAKCFIPRHSINYYRNGKIVRYLLVCFECDGVRFSDDPSESFVKSERIREKQMQELKEVFKDML